MNDVTKITIENYNGKKIVFEIPIDANIDIWTYEPLLPQKLDKPIEELTIQVNTRNGLTRYEEEIY